MGRNLGGRGRVGSGLLTAHEQTNGASQSVSDRKNNISTIYLHFSLRSVLLRPHIITIKIINLYDIKILTIYLTAITSVLSMIYIYIYIYIYILIIRFAVFIDKSVQYH